MSLESIENCLSLQCNVKYVSSATEISSPATGGVSTVLSHSARKPIAFATSRRDRNSENCAQSGRPILFKRSM